MFGSPSLSFFVIKKSCREGIYDCMKSTLNFSFTGNPEAQ